MSQSNNPGIKIGVVGLGHVGLPTALGLAEVGWHVSGTDGDSTKLGKISQGESPYFEPGLGEFLLKHLDSGRFRTVSDMRQLINETDVIFVCVGTPQGDEGQSDLSQVETVARSIASHIAEYKLIVEKSTAPVLTAEQIRRTILRYAPAARQFDIAVNPEFLREGTALWDFMHPDRIVIGVDSPRAERLLTEIYRPFLSGNGSDEAVGNGRLIVTNLATAELIKHASNAFLATKISFINMVADMCEAVGADVRQVARGVGADPRIGQHFLNAGIGFGGYCLPKDILAFARIGEKSGVDVSLLRAVTAVNEARTAKFVDKVRKALWVLQDKKIAIWGLSFKPETDDIRDSPGLKVVAALRAANTSLRLYDPKAMEAFKGLFPAEQGRIEYFDSALAAASGADALLVLTEWSEFRREDLTALKNAMSVPVLMDGRNCLDGDLARKLGFEYHGVGH